MKDSDANQTGRAQVMISRSGVVCTQGCKCHQPSISYGTLKRRYRSSERLAVYNVFVRTVNRAIIKPIRPDYVTLKAESKLAGDPLALESKFVCSPRRAVVANVKVSASLEPSAVQISAPYATAPSSDLAKCLTG